MSDFACYRWVSCYHLALRLMFLAYGYVLYSFHLQQTLDLDGY
jgi:hypothetical protein